MKCMPQKKKKKVQKPSHRRIKAAKLMVENGGYASPAMKGAGYSPAIVKNPQKITATDSFQKLLDKMLPDSLLVRVHKEGLDAVKKFPRIVGRDDDGRPEYEYVEEPDTAIRRGYLELGYKIKGRLTPSDPHGPTIVPIIIQQFQREAPQESQELGTVRIIPQPA